MRVLATREGTLDVEFVGVGTLPYVDLDAAATTPALAEVAEAIARLLPLYGSVHRGSGWKSQLTSAAYEGAREAVREFVAAGPEHEVAFVRGTTEAANVLSACLPAGSVVLAGAHEHHANLLPWARHHVRVVPLTQSPAELLDAFEARLREHRGRVKLVAVTGASNVTGEVFPVCELARLAHAFGAQIFVDAAQLAPHRAIDMAAWGVDHLAFSGHKVYAPYGAGVLVGRRELLDRAAPWLRGGGASANVSRHRVEWASGAQRHEAGSPNVLGAVALGVACDTLAAIGMDAVAAHERRLAAELFDGLAGIDGLKRHVLWEQPDDRIGVAAFTAPGRSPSALADALAAAHAIGVRSGRFCAHMLVDGLTGSDAGAVRASLGLHTRTADVRALIAGLVDVLGRDAAPAPGRPALKLQAPLPFRLAA